ncbi:MAG TPA: cytochrome C oxidase subunit IV family protein [Polyangia bacterium]|nr:cytochrome C oxidase subunit IV family protein [Polyangia bacterium]
MSAAATDPNDAAPQRASRLVLALLALLALTALEVVVAGLPVDRPARITALCGLAMTEALLVLVAFLRLGRQARTVRLAILAPIVLGPAFAVALMLDTAFRVTQR